MGTDKAIGVQQCPGGCSRTLSLRGGRKMRQAGRPGSNTFPFDLSHCVLPQLAATPVPPHPLGHRHVNFVQSYLFFSSITIISETPRMWLFETCSSCGLPPIWLLLLSSFHFS